MSVYSILSNDSGVTALTDQIFTSQAPQDTTPPYIVLDYYNTNPDNLLAGVPNMEQQAIGIDCIAGDQRDVNNLYLACRDVLELSGYITSMSFNAERDKETGYYRTLFDYSYWNNR
tara:strand:+ start:38 stop:385 length:348 start_codon:yes stop_codon:yes gene_type:complete